MGQQSNEVEESYKNDEVTEVEGIGISIQFLLSNQNEGTKLVSSPDKASLSQPNTNPSTDRSDTCAG